VSDDYLEIYEAIIAKMFLMAFILWPSGRIDLDQHAWGYTDVTERFSEEEVAILRRIGADV
jgi:hypothetical protein